MDTPVRVLYVHSGHESGDTAATRLQRADEQLTVVTAQRAEAGLDRLEEGAIDCVISDYELPGMDGIEFVRAVRDRYPELPFVLFSGRDSGSIASRALGAGATDYLQKGAGQYAELADRLLDACKTYRNRQDREATVDLYRTTLNSMSDAVLITDDAGAFTYVCPNVEFIFGYMAEEVEELGTVEALFDEPLFDQETLETDDEISNVETNITDKSGNQRTVLVSIKRVSIREGTTLYTVRDITDRKKSERELRRYERMVNTMLESACIYTEDARFDVVNEYLADFYGVAPEELEGQKSNLVPMIREQADGDPFRELLAGERAEARGEVAGEFPEAGYQVLDYRLTPMVIDGEVEGVVGVTREITERRERERDLKETNALLSTLFETLPAGVIAEDEDRNILAVNDRFFELFGIAGQSDDVIGEDCKRLAREASELFADGERFVDRTEAVIQQRDPVNREDLRLDDGRTFTRSYQPIELGEGNGHLWVYRDVTERKERERTLRRERDRLDEFASVVSHDLRNPLHVAQGRLELAREDAESEHHDAIANALDRMDGLVEDLLALAREGETVRNRQPVELADLVEDCWRNVASGDATIRIESDLVVQADRSRLRQLLENLFRNAIDHSGDDVTVTVGETTDGFYVEDDGPGISPEKRDRVFEAGYSTAYKGTGFGLSIVKEVAEAHGWEIRVTDGSNGGARFEITGIE